MTREQAKVFGMRAAWRMVDPRLLYLSVTPAGVAFLRHSMEKFNEKGRDDEKFIVETFLKIRPDL